MIGDRFHYIHNVARFSCQLWIFLWAMRSDKYDKFFERNFRFAIYFRLSINTTNKYNTHVERNH